MHPDAAAVVTPGFRNPSMDAQRVFRQVLEAMTHPGRILTLTSDVAPSPADLDPAAAAVGLTLLDHDTPVWSDLPTSSGALSWLRFHCGCPFYRDPGQAAFGLVTNALHPLPLSQFFPGTDEAPETAATLIIQVQALRAGTGGRLRGPGINGQRQLAADGLPEDFWAARQRICRAYPTGLDVLLVCDRQLAALPRTTVVNR